MAPAAAVVGDELPALFAGLAGEARLGVAVSGGPDSTALLLLAARWRAARGGTPDLVVLTVDHGLRAEAARECAEVAALAVRLGLAAATLRWNPEPPPVSDVEAAARHARYALLAAAAREHGLGAVLLAHTEDDVAETLLLRLARGSGVYGLGGIPEERVVDGVRFVRPLLGLTKARLVATLAEAGIGWAEDPMNADPRFARARVRAARPALEAIGLDTKTLAATARRLARAAAALERSATGLLNGSTSFAPEGVAVIWMPAFQPIYEEVGLRILARLVQAVRAAEYVPRLAPLERLLEAALSRTVGRVGTLAGVVAERRPRRLWLYREAGRSGLGTTDLAPGGNGLWDGRFRVSAVPDAPPLRIAALGPRARALVADRLGWQTLLPARAAATVPGAFDAVTGDLVATPFAPSPLVAFRHRDPLFAAAAKSTDAIG